MKSNISVLILGDVKDRSALCAVLDPTVFHQISSDFIDSTAKYKNREICVLQVMQAGLLQIDKDVPLNFPLVVIVRGSPNSEVERHLLSSGAHEVIFDEELTSAKLIRAIELAKSRFDILIDKNSREVMFIALCDTLPYQMAYRIVVPPGEKAKFVYVSEGVKYLSGLTREAVLQDSNVLYNQILEEDKPAFNAAEEASVKDLNPFEIEVRKKDTEGNLRWVHIRSFPSLEEDGTIVWDGTESDITSYKNSELAVKELLAKNQILLESERHARSESERNGRIKDEFLATLSHELRTPINAVLGWVQLIKTGRLAPDQVTNAIDVMERNARVQAQLIADLLDMNRIMSGKVHLSMESVDVRHFALAAIESARPSADAKKVNITFSMDSGAEFHIKGDNDKLQQVLWNLLSNAIKFTPQNGEVHVRIVEIGQDVEFSIRDSGVGIKPEFLPYVFDRFRQADASFSRKFGGLGLGLAIVKHLVTLHGGTVRAHSEGEGKGATFTIRFPLASSAPTVAQEIRSEKEEAINNFSLEGIRILLLDDEPDALELVRQILTHSKADVTAAYSAQKAIEFIERDRFDFDLIISDIGMPEKDGFEFISEIRSRFAKAAGIPAIALTAFARPEDRTRILAAGFCKHITKPVDAVELLWIIRDLLSTSNKMDVANYS